MTVRGLLIASMLGASIHASIHASTAGAQSADQALRVRAGAVRGTDETVRPGLWVSYLRQVDRTVLSKENPFTQGFRVELDAVAATDARFTPDPSTVRVAFERLSMLATYRPSDSPGDVDAPASGAITEWGAFHLSLDADLSTNQAFTEQAASFGGQLAYENFKAQGWWALIPSAEARVAGQLVVSSDIREAVDAEQRLESRTEWALRWQLQRGDLRDMAAFTPFRVRWGVDSYDIKLDTLVAVRGARESFNWTAGLELAPPRSWRRLRAFRIDYRHGAHPSQPRLASSVAIGVESCRGNCR